MMTSQIVLAAALLVPAQDKQPSPNPAAPAPADRNFNLTAGIEVRTIQEATNEQIEVMRALLARKLGRTAGAQPMMQPSPTLGGSALFQDLPGGTYYPGGQGLIAGFPPANRNIATSVEAMVEGAYLDGYGVVFTVTLPATARDPRAGTDAKPEPILTDWERERRRLLGQPVPEKTTTPKQTSISDILVKLLADNGKNFTALKEDERVVIAVTFRGHASGATAIVPPPTTNSVVDTSASVLNQPQPARENRFATLENLGDLHLKQGQPDKAIEAYIKAAAAAEQESTDKNESSSRDRASHALTRLAQAYLAAGKMDEARRAMDRAQVVREEKEESPAKTAPGTNNKAPEFRGPARLTVSAPKKLLDLVGNGQMSMDEFRKRVTAEYAPAAKH
jgi:hypothetical protein